MKKNYIYFFVSLLLPFLWVACEQEVAVYDNPDGRIYFTDVEAAGQEDSVTRYTFVYYMEEVQRDTVWLDVSASGFVADYPRAFILKQVMTGENDAVAGKHYVAFDDPEVKDTYVMPAGKARTRVPLIVKRDDPALDETEMNLQLTFEENQYFKTGFRDSLYKSITISDILTRPEKWDFYACYYMTGPYGPVKHRFMMQVVAPMGILINDKFFEERVNIYSPDMGLMGYWYNVFYDALEKENAARLARGEDVLREAPEAGETIGQEVRFVQFEM